jgi:multimeric flavodoxin WrbA
MFVLGVSGSPTKNANTDKLVKAVLAATGHDTEFVKLSDINVGPCTACMKCVYTNKCVIDDDFKWLGPKSIEADALVVGSPTYHALPSAYTKAFLERFLYTYRHVRLLTKGKVGAAIAVGGYTEKYVADWIGGSMRAAGMDLAGTLTAKGTICCFVCGPGETCPYTSWNAYSLGGDNSVRGTYKDYLEILPDNMPYVKGSARILKKYRNVEDEPEVMERARELGRVIRAKLEVDKEERLHLVEDGLKRLALAAVEGSRKGK